jgi:hypothetical protein
MNLITKVEVPESPVKISYNSKCLFTGSCFAENIGDKLLGLKFPVQINPLGINYNPFSLGISMETIVMNKKISDIELFFSNGLWSSYDFHGKFSNNEKQKCVKSINDATEEAYEFLKNAEYLFISFGTAYVYQLKSNGNIVSNCHKQPDNIFSRRLVEVSEITDYWVKIINEISVFNDKLKIIFTISPVRHKRDGFIANQLSKSVLFVAVNKLIDMFENVFYFPSYEIMMDELRDYRYYADDMIHPSSLAVNYIMENFAESFFSEDTKVLNRKISKIITAVNHRPFNQRIKEHQIFCKKIISEIKQIQNLNLGLDFMEELRLLENL